MLKRSLAFVEKLRNVRFREELENLVRSGMMRYKDMLQNHDENNLVLYGESIQERCMSSYELGQG